MPWLTVSTHSNCRVRSTSQVALHCMFQKKDVKTPAICHAQPRCHLLCSLRSELMLAALAEGTSPSDKAPHRAALPCRPQPSGTGSLASDLTQTTEETCRFLQAHGPCSVPRIYHLKQAPAFPQTQRHCPLRQGLVRVPTALLLETGVLH